MVVIVVGRWSRLVWFCCNEIFFFGMVCMLGRFFGVFVVVCCGVWDLFWVGSLIKVGSFGVGVGV